MSQQIDTKHIVYRHRKVGNATLRYMLHKAHIDHLEVGVGKLLIIHCKEVLSADDSHSVGYNISQKKSLRAILHIEIISIFAQQKEPRAVRAPQSVKREFGGNPRQYQLL